MKRKSFLFLLIFFSAWSLSFAQSGSMTDNQVVSFIMAQREQGVPQSSIIQKLMQKGVTVEQLRRVRKNYQSQQEQFGQVGQVDTKDVTKNRQRVNRQMRETQTQNSNLVEPLNSNGTKVNQQYTREETQALFSDELTFLDIDSVMYHQNLLKEYNQSQIFGHNIFNNNNLTFEPSQNMPTPSNYRLGSGDKVFIDIWGASQKSIEGTISPDGTVVIESVGPVKLSGLTVREATKKLRGVLGRYYSSSQISLSVGETRSIQVQVMGEVKMPGTYTLSALSTAFNALYAAGGIGDIGTMRDIKVLRNGTQISSIDLYDFILNGNLTGNVRLQDNDVIQVGAYKTLVCLRGKVKRPMFYEMRKNESVAMAIDYAGGFAGDAYRKNVRLIRKGGAEYSIYNIDEFDMGSFAVQDGDSVYVDSVLQRYSNMAELNGAVMYPGKYQIDGSVYTLKTLIETANGLREDAFTERAIIHRQKDDLTLEALTVNLGNILNGTEPDVPLKKNDRIFIQSKLDMQGEQTLEITGEVNFPGKFLYADKTSIRDLILQAGGLTEAASLAKVDVFRRVNKKDALQATDTIAQHFSFDLRDGLVVGADEFSLEPYDRVIVRKSPDYTEQQNVMVRGCVNFVGSYSMKSNNYRLTDLITDAGGITDLGYAKGARLERRLTEEERLQREASLRAQQIALYEESMTTTDKNFDLNRADSLLNMKLDLGYMYPVAIDLEEAINNPNSSANILLRDGDVLTVPQFSNTVKISGDVMYPSSVNYKEGETLSYYIDRAGGYGENARKRKVYAIYMNGSVQLIPRHYKKAIQPGCEIVVPSKNQRNKLSTQETMAIGTSAASVATMMVTIANILK